MTGGSLSRRFLNTSIQFCGRKIHYVQFMICAKFHVVKKSGHEFQSLATPGNVGITLLHELYVSECFYTFFYQIL